MSPHFAISNSPPSTERQKLCQKQDDADLQFVLATTQRLSEEVLCAKLSGTKPLDQHITKLVIIAIELRKIGVQYPASLKYALDIPSSVSAAEVDRSEQYGELKGYIEEITSEHVRGWALNEGSAGMPVELEILANKVPVALISASHFRIDLIEAGIGSGCHGFMHRFDYPISLIRDKKIVVRRRFDRARLEALIH